MDIETRLTNLENLVYAFIKSQNKVDGYRTADIEGCRQAESTQAQAINDVQTNVSGNYDESIPYAENEYCVYGGNLYRFTQANGRGIPPTNTTYWVLCDIATELNRIINLINK